MFQDKASENMVEGFLGKIEPVDIRLLKLDIQYPSFSANAFALLNDSSEISIDKKHASGLFLRE